MVFHILSKTKDASKADRPGIFYKNRRIRGKQKCFCGNEKSCLTMFKASIDAKDDQFCVLITVGAKAREDKKVQEEIRRKFGHLDIAKGAIFIRGHHIKDEYMKNQTEGLTDLNVKSLLSFEEVEQRYRKANDIKNNSMGRTLFSPQSKKGDAVLNTNRMVLSPIPTNYNIMSNGKRAPNSSGRKDNNRKRWSLVSDGDIDGNTSVTRCLESDVDC